MRAVPLAARFHVHVTGRISKGPLVKHIRVYVNKMSWTACSGHIGSITQDTLLGSSQDLRLNFFGPCLVMSCARPEQRTMSLGPPEDANLSFDCGGCVERGGNQFLRLSSKFVKPSSSSALSATSARFWNWKKLNLVMTPIIT